MAKKMNKRSRFVRVQRTKQPTLGYRKKEEKGRNLVALTGSCITSFLTFSTLSLSLLNISDATVPRLFVSLHNVLTRNVRTQLCSSRKKKNRKKNSE
jgi:hypothetical protein